MLDPVEVFAYSLSSKAAFGVEASGIPVGACDNPEAACDNRVLLDAASVFAGLELPVEQALRQEHC